MRVDPRTCPVEGCNWTNIYMSCQDGSREYAAYQHAQTHAPPLTPAERAVVERFEQAADGLADE